MRESRDIHGLRQKQVLCTICNTWPIVLQRTKVQLWQARLRAAISKKLEFHKQPRTTKQKVETFKKQALELREELMVKSAADIMASRPEEWDETTKGKEGKLRRRTR